MTKKKKWHSHLIFNIPKINNKENGESNSIFFIILDLSDISLPHSGHLISAMIINPFNYVHIVYFRGNIRICNHIHMLTNAPNAPPLDNAYYVK